ncbi:hypothetical protein [Rariglobus hedericola]|uniref:hypothetical protein n=1 Tax=Rariglobus hedericola TaxID=2597822 RepID=UPI001EEF9A60|nr:hypothetical protein [Rariglobus hedericola]
MQLASIRTIFSRQAGLLACLVVFCAALPHEVEAQSRRYRPPARYIQFKAPDQAEGRKILEDFRKLGPSGDYYLEFDLRVLPRRGDTRVISGGRLWGGRNEIGPVSRVELPAVDDTSARRLLVQNGAQGSVWVAPLTGAITKAGALDASALFAPLAGTDLTAFDLQMPFLYWGDFVFEGLAPVRGRPAHVFLLYPPADIVALKPELTGVRVYLDTQFGALVQAQQIGAEERVLKSITVLDLKKIDDQWMVKVIDLRDETTRNKTQFVVTGAAMGLDFSGMLFEASNLAEAVTPPPANRIRRLGP